MVVVINVIIRLMMYWNLPASLFPYWIASVLQKLSL